MPAFYWWSLPLIFSNKTVYASLISLIFYGCHCLRTSVITLRVLNLEYKLRSFSLRNFLHPRTYDIFILTSKYCQNYAF
jgi:hypothetical protein